MSHKMSEEEFDNFVKGKVGEEVAAQVQKKLSEEKDGLIKEQIESQIKESLASMAKPTPEEEEVEKAKKDGNGKFKSFGEYLIAIYKARHYQKLDERLVYVDSQGKISKPELSNKEREVKTLTEGVDSAGGFLVFEEHLKDIKMLALEQAIVRNNGAMVLPMKSDMLTLPRIDETSHASHLRGGIVAYWTAEAQDKTASEPKFGETRLVAKELSGYTVVSNSLLADSAVSLEPFLKTVFGEAWPWFEDYAFINGLGGGQPLGFLNSNALIAVTRQANNTVRWRDIANIWRQVLPASRKRGIWLINHEVLSELIVMVAENAAPAATAGHVIWVNPQQGAAGQIPGTIMGRPYIETEKVPALGSAYDFGFYDLGYYLVGDRQTLTIDASTHVYFLSNKTAWRFVLRVDGQPWIQNKLTPKHGTRQLSPFVALAATS